MRIRPALTTDVPEIFAMIVELADFEKLRDRVTTSPEILRDALFGRPHPFAEVLLAEDENQKILGSALFFQNFSTFLGLPGIYLEDLYVREFARGRGVGKTLLSSVANIAVDRGCERLDWAVLDWNEDAIRFYRSLGASALTDWTTFRLEGNALRAFGQRFGRE